MRPFKDFEDAIFYGPPNETLPAIAEEPILISQSQRAQSQESQSQSQARSQSQSQSQSQFTKDF